MKHHNIPPFHTLVILTHSHEYENILIMKNTEQVLKALANKRRLAILKFLKKEKSGTVGEIAEAIGLSFKSTSRHLAILYAGNILDREQKSREMWYSIPSKINHIAKYIIHSYE